MHHLSKVFVPRRLVVVPATLATILAVSLPVQAQNVGTALDTSEQALKNTAQSQERIDGLDEETQALLNDYRANLKQLEQLQRYNESQRRQIAAQEREKESLQQDIDLISSLQRSVQPLMDDMLSGLESLVAADVPFLLDEREARVERLKAIMDDPEQSPAQRYRLLVEAYQIENEYGRTIEAYRSDVTADGREYENAQFLRVGRLALIFKTDDNEVLKIYNKRDEAWEDLDRSFLDPVKQGIRVAREQIPPELLRVPVLAPQQADGSEG